MYIYYYTYLSLQRCNCFTLFLYKCVFYADHDHIQLVAEMYLNEHKKHIRLFAIEI